MLPNFRKPNQLLFARLDHRLRYGHELLVIIDVLHGAEHRVWSNKGTYQLFPRSRVKQW